MAQRTTRRSLTSYRLMPLSQVERLVPEATKNKVSKVARGPTGFLKVYKSAPNATLLSQRMFSENVSWLRRREGFIGRHLPQYKKNPTIRHWLALAMWAYNPGRKPALVGRRELN
ncbi:hypothetical protein EMVG_00282 [Emiliania huxleyi virus PS401]|nr:hypothetical protein EMVG_00282 [Emiliania huxleyi virus PS401]